MDACCQNCFSWKQIDHPRNVKRWGYCGWVRGDYLHEDYNELEQDDAFITMPYGYEGSLVTGPEFGCVQFMEREEETE